MKRVWFSGGQSNATGWGTSNIKDNYGIEYSLPSEYDDTKHQINVFNGNDFEKLKPFNDVGYNKNGSRLNNISMEHSFFHYLAKEYPNDNFYSIKYSHGGANINQLLVPTKRIFELGINKMSGEYKVDGLLWYQGESDQHDLNSVKKYPAKLKNLINHCISLGSKDLKVYIVRPNTFYGRPYQLEWNDMIEDFVKINNAKLFNADDLEVPKNEGYIHVSGTGLIRLGLRFFEEFTGKKIENFSPQNEGQQTMIPTKNTNNLK